MPPAPSAASARAAAADAAGGGGGGDGGAVDGAETVAGARPSTVEEEALYINEQLGLNASSATSMNDPHPPTPRRVYLMRNGDIPNCLLLTN